MTRTTTIIIATVVVAACSGKGKDAPSSGSGKSGSGSAPPAEPTPTLGSCILADQKCYDFTAESVKAQGPAVMKSMCESGKLVLDQPCPSAELVATCAGDDGHFLVRFYGGERPGNCPACPDGKFPAWTRERVGEECTAMQLKLQ